MQLSFDEVTDEHLFEPGCRNYGLIKFNYNKIKVKDQQIEGLYNKKCH